MSKQYDEYLTQHIANVKQGFIWMRQHGLIPDCVPSDYGRNLVPLNIPVMHDNSKYEMEEYEAYDDYFYGKEGKDEDDIQVINDTFDYAWLHHIHHNPHHWQYWLLFEDEGNVKALEMPEKYVYEMIADWWSFSWSKGKLTEIFDWYEEHKEKMKLHPKTKKLVETILKGMKNVLREENDDGKNYDAG